MSTAVTNPKPTAVTQLAAGGTQGTVSADDVTRAWSAKFHVIFGIVALVILVGGFGGWAFGTRIAGAIIAPGAIEVEQNRQVVQHPDGGVIDEIEVRDGDIVEAGQILIRLDPEQLQSELTIVQNQLFELMARRGRLEAERDTATEITFDPLLIEAASGSDDVASLLDGQERLFEQRTESLAAEREQLIKRVGQIESQNEGIRAQQEALDIQLNLIQEELANKQSLLERGLAQSYVVLELERNQAALLGQRGELAAAIAQNEGRMTEIEIEILKLGQRRREEAITTLRDLGYQELELAERRRALIARLGRLDIRAPFPGVVHAMQVYAEREVIQPAQALLYIVPQDQRLLVSAQIETTNIDQIHVGQEVLMRFAALDSRQTPELTGRVLTVSPDAFNDEQTGRSFYRARIELLPGELDKLPEGTVLIPGMPVETYLRTEDHSPMSYLVKPLAEYFTKAFR